MNLHWRTVIAISFTFYDGGDPDIDYEDDYGSNDRHDSTELVRKILFWFSCDRGCYIPNQYCILHVDEGPSHIYNKTYERNYEAFRTELTMQLYELLRVKPRWKSPTKSEDRYFIYYS